MGFFDKIMNMVKKDRKPEVSAAVHPEAEDIVAAVPVTCDEPQTSVPVYDTGDAHFEAIVTEDKFPGYTIDRAVHANVFDPSAHPKCYPITYLFRKDGAPVLAVLVMNRNQYRAMIAVGTYRVLDARNIPYIRFFKGMENREDYIINRISENLN